jgi:hypothetical protein
MTIKIPKDFIYDFAERLLLQVIPEKAVEDDLESFVYEAGERNWDEDDEDNFLIEEEE